MQQQPAPQHPIYVEDDEITLKDLILSAKEYSRNVFRNWWVVGLIAIPVVGIFALQTYFEKATYSASIEFMVNEDDGSGGLGGITGLLGSFGLGKGTSKYNLEKILALAKSDKIVYPMLFDTITIDGSADLIANHLIRVYDLHEDWQYKSDTKWHGFYFTSGD